MTLFAAVTVVLLLIKQLTQLPVSNLALMWLVCMTAFGGSDVFVQCQRSMAIMK